MAKPESETTTTNDLGEYILVSDPCGRCGHDIVMIGNGNEYRCGCGSAFGALCDECGSPTNRDDNLCSGCANDDKRNNNL